MRTFKERQSVSTQVFSLSHEYDKWNQCDDLKNTNKDLENTLDLFTKGINNSNILLGNKIASYNMTDLGYEVVNDCKKIDKMCQNHKTPYCKKFQCNYFNKNDRTALFCFIKKTHENKSGHPPSCFYKKIGM